MDYLFLAVFWYNNSIHASTQQSPYLVLYNYQVNNSPKKADLVHLLGEAKMIDNFAHNLVNLKNILEIAQTRYLDNMDKSRTDNYPRYKLLDKIWIKKPENYDGLPFYKLATRKYGPFKVIGVDEAKKNYQLDI